MTYVEKMLECMEASGRTPEEFGELLYDAMYPYCRDLDSEDQILRTVTARKVLLALPHGMDIYLKEQHTARG